MAIAGGRTLIDDFHDLGYRVAYFSGQNDTHGGSESLVGFERADYFYDARTDTSQRTSRTSLPVSLQVSADVVLSRVRSYLADTDSDPKPLFFYVNLVDNHFPYHHDGLDPMLGVRPVSRSEIRHQNAQRVFDTYLQAVANVDRSIGALVELWNQHAGAAPFIVTADHGQSFYENGLLGHGQAVDEAQARVPLIVVGIGGLWPEPLALSDLRGLVLTHLFEEPARPRFRADRTAQDLPVRGVSPAPGTGCASRTRARIHVALQRGPGARREGTDGRRPLARPSAGRGLDLGVVAGRSSRPFA